MMIITMKQPVLPPTTIQPSTIQSYDTSACIPIILRPSFIYPVRRHAVQALAFNWTTCISNDVDDEDQKRKNFSRRLLTHSMDGICYKEKYVLQSVSSTLYRKSLSVRYCPLMFTIFFSPDLTIFSLWLMAEKSLSSSRFKVNVQFLSRWIAGSRWVGRLVSDDYITRRTHLSLDQWIPLTEPQSLIHWPADKIVTIVSNKILKSLNVIY